MTSRSNPSSTNASAEDGKGADSTDLTSVVQEMLNQMQTKFQAMSNQIIGRIDEMGSRIDDLEKSIEELMTQTGTKGTTGGAQPSSTTHGPPQSHPR